MMLWATPMAFLLRLDAPCALPVALIMR